MHVYNVLEQNGFPKKDTYTQYNEYFVGIPNDHISPELVLEAILEQVSYIVDGVVFNSSTELSSASQVISASSINIDRTSQDTSMKQTDCKAPLYWLQENCLLYEYYNGLAYKNFNKFDSSDFVDYYKTLNTLRTQLKLDTLCDNQLETMNFLQSWCDNVSDQFFLERLSTESLIQVLVDCTNSYDADVKCYNFDSELSSVVVRFSRENSIFKSSPYGYFLPTNVCFRDFMKFVWPELQHWIEKEENKDEAREVVAVLRKEALKSDKLNQDFFRNGSLKKPSVEYLDDDDTFEVEMSEKSITDGVSLKSGTIIFI